jgi:hypothetical protein
MPICPIAKTRNRPHPRKRDTSPPPPHLPHLPLHLHQPLLRPRPHCRIALHRRYVEQTRQGGLDLSSQAGQYLLFGALGTRRREGGAAEEAVALEGRYGRRGCGGRGCRGGSGEGGCVVVVERLCPCLEEGEVLGEERVLDY